MCMSLGPQGIGQLANHSAVGTPAVLISKESFFVQVLVSLGILWCILFVVGVVRSHRSNKAIQVALKSHSQVVLPSGKIVAVIHGACSQ